MTLLRQELLFPELAAPEAADAHWYAASTVKGRLVALMADGLWRTLGEMVQTAGGAEASVSAQLRALRREGWVVRKRSPLDRRAAYEYQVSRS